MKITNFTDYALRTLMYLSVHHQRLCSVREVSEHYGISRNHVVKVVHRLSKEGYVDGQKGHGGGIRLRVRAENVNLGELFKKLEPRENLVECFREARGGCRITPICGLKGILEESHDGFLQVLGRYTLADTVENPSAFFPDRTEASGARRPLRRLPSST